MLSFLSADKCSVCYGKAVRHIQQLPWRQEVVLAVSHGASLGLLLKRTSRRVVPEQWYRRSSIVGGFVNVSKHFLRDSEIDVKPGYEH